MPDKGEWYRDQLTLMLSKNTELMNEIEQLRADYRRVIEELGSVHRLCVCQPKRNFGGSAWRPWVA